MIGKFKWCKFADCNIGDSFFDSLRKDYQGFDAWFTKKSKEGKEAFVYRDEYGIGAFLCLKTDDNEPIELVGETLPALNRLKISTLKLAERVQGIRLGEGAIGIALWHWQQENSDEVYVTVFEKHQYLIDLLNRFGFQNVGLKKDTGECVLIKNKQEIDYSDPYKSFPFINPNFTTARLIPINHDWHDTLFPFSELMRTQQEVEEIAAANGITKVYIGTPFSTLQHKVGEPVLIYRISNHNPKKYRSVVTSYCTIVNVLHIKNNRHYNIDLASFINIVGNKSVFTNKELISIYNKPNNNIVMFELIYNGFFGKGCNVNQNDLKNNGLWFDMHPYKFRYNKSQFINILEMGERNVQNIIIN